MAKNERHSQILLLLRQNRSISIDELAKKLYVSPSTARRDIAFLEKSGVLYHHYGSVSLIDQSKFLLPLELRRQEMQYEKIQIGKKAATLIESGDVIFIDSSSTCFYLANELSCAENITVITNSLNVLNILSSKNISVYCLGGKLIPYSMAFLGSVAENTFEMLQPSKCFFSVAALSYDGILSDNSEKASQLYRLLLKKDCKKYLLCDSSKLGKRSMIRIGTLNEVSCVISNSDIFNFVAKPDSSCPEIIVAN